MGTNVQAGAGSGTREWDAGTYDRVSTPQQEWARPVVARLGLRGDETVLDAGCGSGRVTEVLLDALPRGEVIAVDGSAAMVAEARALLGEERVSYIHSDLLDLDLDEAADAVFSNAVFHWITDHERLFKRLRSALRPGGRIEAQCGGEGNVARFYAAVAEVVGERAELASHIGDFQPHRFASPDETERILTGLGFEDVSCTLEPRPVHPPEPREFIRSVCLVAHSELLPEELRGELLDAVMDRLGPDPELDYVRLNISARKPVGGDGD
ncbi:MAG: methyltransferase domain-containing protein [Solirubrobacterales bacterium]